MGAVIPRVVAWCARHPWLVIALAVLFAAAGERARRALAGDVVPDLADPQIGIVADWMGHPAPEVAANITSPLTAALDGLPGIKAVRGASMSGMAYVDVVLATARGIDETRAAIVDRVAGIRPRLPGAARLQIGPPASSTGWVYEYALIDPAHVASLLELRHIQEEVLVPALASIPGVAEVASVGGGLQQVRVELQPRELRARGLAFTDVLAALRAAFADAGLAKVPLASLASLPVARGARPDGANVPLGEVARIRVSDDMQTGLADVDGYPAVGGIVVARRDADLAPLVQAVERTLERERARLPHRPADPARLDSGAAADVQIVTTYNRLDLATRVHRTLFGALGEEVGVVVVVILLFLVHFRSALLPLVTLPVVLLLTFAGMWLLDVPATVMSLAGIGIALGMAVDADVVVLEASHRRLEGAPRSESAAGLRDRVLLAAQSLAPAIVTALAIAALSFLPVFAFTGETGRLFWPLALTKTLVVAAAGVVALTLGPALRDRLLSRVPPEFGNPLVRGLVRAYRPFVHFALTRPALTLITAALAVASCLPLVPRLGGEFLPRIDEGDLLFMPTTLPGAPPDEAAVELFRQDRAMLRFKEVATVFGKVGRANSATDPAPFSMAETTIRLRPRAEWPAVPRPRWYSGWAPEALRRVLRRFWPERGPRTSRELVEELDRATHRIGWASAWTGPARARMDMMATGVRTPVGIRVVAPNPARLDALGTALRRVVARVPGTRSAVFESLGGQTWLDFTSDPEALARFDVDPEAVRSTVTLVTTGGQVGEIEHQGRRLRVRISPQAPDVEPRGPADVLREITVRSRERDPSSDAAEPARAAAPSQPVPLALLGRATYVNRPAALRTERGALVAYVYVDLDPGVDVAGYVERARREVDAAVARGEPSLTEGERVEWTGQYELLTAGQRRLAWIVPVVLLSMLALLWIQLRSLTESLIALVSVPFALVGSVWTLFLLSYPLSAPVWVGLLSTLGLAMQTGVVMVVYIDEAFHRRLREGRMRTRDDIVAAHAEGTVQRLRPKLMTVTTMAASLLPLLWSEGAGAEIVKRVAAPMLGGLATSALLTLEVLPVVYTMWRHAQLRRAQRTGVPLAALVGEAPAWARADPASDRATGEGEAP